MDFCCIGEHQGVFTPIKNYSENRGEKSFKAFNIEWCISCFVGRPMSRKYSMEDKNVIN